MMDACFRSLLVLVSSPSCLPVPVAITKSYAECHSWFLVDRSHGSYKYVMKIVDTYREN